MSSVPLFTQAAFEAQSYDEVYEQNNSTDGISISYKDQLPLRESNIIFTQQIYLKLLLWLQMISY